MTPALTTPRQLAAAGRFARKEEGRVTINFGGSQAYAFRSRLHPSMSPTTIYITDVPDQLDPLFHPIHGSKGNKRVYHGWHYNVQGRRSREGHIAVKWVTGMARIRRLEQERENYCRLEDLQGHVIPELLDYLEGTIEGVDVACLIIEWCGGQLPEDHKLLSALKLEIATRLHAVGWTHGALLDPESHHFVAVEKKSDGKRNPLRIVDLSEATHFHPCPFTELASSCKDCCYELDALAAMRLMNM